MAATVRPVGAQLISQGTGEDAQTGDNAALVHFTDGRLVVVQRDGDRVRVWFSELEMEPEAPLDDPESVGELVACSDWTELAVTRPTT